MKISYQWLQDFADLETATKDVKELAQTLDRIGLAVESIDRRGEDWILDLEVTTNRPDCLNHLGVARELAAQLRLKLKEPDLSTPLQGEDTASFSAGVRIENAALCPRYAARVIRNVRIKESPRWLSARLESLDQRPINNIVDITNYVLLELGHPLHAFDYERLAEHSIVVRAAKPGETLRTLDGVQHSLDPDMLMICDARHPIALAGIMGGQETEISSSTRTLLLESAYFAPSSIRATAKRLGVRTEASSHFERGADPEMPVRALNWACRMIQEITGGICVGPVIDQYPDRQSPCLVRLRDERIRQVVGQSFPRDLVLGILTRLGFEIVSEEKDRLRVQVPSFRQDVGIEDDLVEEIARHYGYDRIQSTYPAASIAGSFLPTQAHDRLLTRLLSGFGFFEAFNYVFSTPHSEALFWGSLPAMVPLANPRTEEDTHLRTSLVPGLLQCTSRNIHRGNKNVRLFEVGKVFFPSPSGQLEDYKEITRLGLVGTGAFYHPFWSPLQDDFQFYHLKGVVKELIQQLNQEPEFHATELPFLQPEAAAEISVGGKNRGWLGPLHPRLAEAYKFSEKVYIAELVLDPFYAQELPEPVYSKLGRFPAVESDLSFLIDKEVQFDKIVKAIQALNISDLADIRLIDLYQGGALPKGKVNLTIRLTFTNSESTLTQAEVNQHSEAVFSTLRSSFAVEGRS